MSDALDADTRAKEAHNNPEDCPSCGGRGRVPRRDDRPFPGGVTGMKDCPDCGGSGIGRHGPDRARLQDDDEREERMREEMERAEREADAEPWKDPAYHWPPEGEGE